MRDDDDVFGIEGTKHVDKDEAIQVHSFCRSLSQVFLDAHLPAKVPTSSTKYVAAARDVTSLRGKLRSDSGIPPRALWGDVDSAAPGDSRAALG